MKIIISGFFTIIGLISVISLYTFFTYRKNRSQYKWNILTNWFFNTGNSINRYYIEFLTYLTALFTTEEPLEVA